MTDNKGRRARRGWVFFDADCAFCMSIARRLQPALEARGFGVATLQDPRAQAHLTVPADELLDELRLLTEDGRQFGGADAIVFIARHVWWGWPFWLLAQIPGMRFILRTAYRKIAQRRHCAAASCPHPGAHA
ncbi:MAG TPA: DCC1-like thiol-disulfide oxidoreductase family protein [Candidatus Acidoferrales bacterium]|nr:DCC1-like thiol-disulfide oxidoreductase family protein [Candidatus Acidoferrales bacterium]